MDSEERRKVSYRSIVELNSIFVGDLLRVDETGLELHSESSLRKKSNSGKLSDHFVKVKCQVLLHKNPLKEQPHGCFLLGKAWFTLQDFTESSLTIIMAARFWLVM